MSHALRAVWREIFTDHASILAAGLAYYAVFGLLPALAAAAALWGQLGSGHELRQLLGGQRDLLPPAAAQVLSQFVTSVPRGFGGGMVLLFNLAAVIWTASLASRGLLTVLNIVYDVREARGRLHRFAVALAMALGGIGLLFTVAALVALAPLAANWLLWLRWPTLVALFAAALGLLFRYGPNRASSPVFPLACGIAAGTVLCMLISSCIALYVAHVGRFGVLYGSLGSIAVALLWFYGTSFALLVGAQLDAVLTASQAEAGRNADQPSPNAPEPQP